MTNTPEREAQTKVCARKECGKVFTRGKLVDNAWIARSFCSQECARQQQWQGARGKRAVTRRKEPAPEKMLTRCPECRAVKMNYSDDRVRWHASIAEFTHLPVETCPTCQSKSTLSDIEK